ncbi:MAG: helix-turn-helix domain-containing protein [Xanthomonadales bacterium]|nr:helix-turn-helix domain-containing protein [Xanthomonadales bacterium]
MNELQRKRSEKLAAISTETNANNDEISPARRDPLTRQDWIQAAKELLIQGGVENIRIARLAESLDVTRGGFYWLFNSRDELLDDLLNDWKTTNTLPFEKILQTEDKGIEELHALFDMWMEEKEYSPAYDAAVRDWARMSETTAKAVNETDSRRVDLMKNIFLDMGYADEEAFVRARITYFHQVGYYILGLGESREERYRVRHLYTKILSGQNIR